MRRNPDKWLKEIYEPEVEKRRMSYGGKQLRYMGDLRGGTWKKHNPYFGQQDFWNPPVTLCSQDKNLPTC